MYFDAGMAWLSLLEIRRMGMFVGLVVGAGAAPAAAVEGPASACTSVMVVDGVDVAAAAAAIICEVKSGTAVVVCSPEKSKDRGHDSRS
jgi:hypothetical protein